MATKLVDFWAHLRSTPGAHGVTVSIRDLLAWAEFVHHAAPACGALRAYVHGAFVCVLDGIGLGTGASLEVRLAPLVDCFQSLDLTKSMAQGEFFITTGRNACGL